VSDIFVSFLQLLANKNLTGAEPAPTKKVRTFLVHNTTEHIEAIYTTLIIAAYVAGAFALGWFGERILCAPTEGKSA
jgi:hypothetical protein